MTATLFDFRDLDLLLKMNEESDDSGWLETQALAATLGLDDQLGAVGRRLAWMKRYGMVKFDEKRRMWQLTPGAHRVIESRLRAAQEKRLEDLPEESMIDVMAHITNRYWTGNRMLANMLRREFLYGTQPSGRRRR